MSAVRPTGKRQRRRRLRLLPATLAAVALLLTVRVGELWRGFDPGPVTTAIAADGEDVRPSGAEAPAANAGAAVADTGGATTSPGQENEPEDPMDLETRFSEEELAVLLDLSRRRDELMAREGDMEARSRLLDAAEIRLDKRIAELDQLRTTLEALVRQYDEQEKGELESVVKIYETMKAKDAARILEELTLPILMGIVETMKERKTAAILAEMKAERAREITAELARRREIDLSRVSGDAGGDG